MGYTYNDLKQIVRKKETGTSFVFNETTQDIKFIDLSRNKNLNKELEEYENKIQDPNLED